MRRGRVAVVAVLAVAILLAGAVTTELLRAHAPTVTAPATAHRPVAPPPARGPLLPDTASTVVPSGAGVAAVLATPAGRSVAASVVDVASGTVLLDHRATMSLLPASTAKLATAVAVLTALPPDETLVTRVVAGPAPGQVVMVGGGDVTLATGRPSGYPIPASVDDLAAQVRTALAGVPVTGVLVDDTAYPGPSSGPGWRPSYLTTDVAPVSALSVDGGRVAPGLDRRVADPALAAGKALAAALGSPAVPVGRAQAPPGAAVMGQVRSPPLPELVELMLQRSDNDIAESLARRVALAEGLAPTFDGAGTAIGRALLRALPAQAAGIVLTDGSGLSRLDRAQPAALTGLLVAVARDTSGRLSPLLSGLPVAGYDGTLQDRFRAGASLPAAGQVRAKTGTLEGLSALAGLVRTRDGRLLAFDLAADGVAPGANTPAELALDGLAAALASCGCP